MHPPAQDPRPLIVHVLYRLDTGGLENGVVNLINHMDPAAWRHAVVALTDITSFSKRIQRSDVQFFALHKPPGHGIWQFPKLFRLFRDLKPQIVHSRNLAALEAQVPAWAARVPARIHGEHGWDVADPTGEHRVFQRVRRLYRPFVHHYVALSRESADYLVRKVHVAPPAISQIYNGVDTLRFRPDPSGAVLPIPGCPFDPSVHWIVGTVGRMKAVKDQTLLTRAFVLAVRQAPALRDRLRLVLVGEGPLRREAQALLDEAGMSDLGWLPGERNDVPDVLRGMHLFVLPSLAEGISNTILEAMASAVPVVATAVGGNADLVADGLTGHVVPAADPDRMASCLIGLAQDPPGAHAMGLAGRQRVESRFSLQAMVAAYQSLYERHVPGRAWQPRST